MTNEIIIPKTVAEAIPNSLERTSYELTLGIRQPVTPQEIQIAKEIQEIRDLGGIIEIPSDI